MPQTYCYKLIKIAEYEKFVTIYTNRLIETTSEELLDPSSDVYLLRGDMGHLDPGFPGIVAYEIRLLVSADLRIFFRSLRRWLIFDLWNNVFLFCVMKRMERFIEYYFVDKFFSAFSNYFKKLKQENIRNNNFF